MRTPIPIAVLAATLAAVPQEAPCDAYERGLALIAADSVEDALVLWVAARTGVPGPAVEDPRIGRAFVEAVAASGLTDYEELATDMFYWGLSANTAAVEPYRTEILEEGRRTYALEDSLLARYWAERGAEDPAALARELERYWLERDPTPATRVNERLIEHWRRVAHARGEFLYNRTSPYGTDERGTFHVRYGEPDTIFRGFLSVSSRDERETGLSMLMAIRFDKRPRYEIWEYRRLHADSLTQFLFGNIRGDGVFRLVTGIHQLIPFEAGFNNRLRPAIEYAYYSDVAHAGGRFAPRFDELYRMRHSDFTISGGLEGVSLRHRSDDLRAARRPRPAAVSDFDRRPRNSLAAQAARILDGHAPRILVLAVSSPVWTPRTDAISLGLGNALAARVASHTVVLRDPAFNELVRAEMLPLGGRDDASTAVLRHTRAIGHLSVVAEYGTPGIPWNHWTAALPGHAHFTPGPPLSPPGDGFQVSDLIVGIAPPAELDLGDMPVPLLPTTRVWRGDPLRVYFEIYHPRAAEAAGDVGFDVQIRVVPRDVLPGSPGQTGRTGTAPVTIRLEAWNPEAEHFFDLDLGDEHSGDLQVVLEVSDPETGVTHRRAAPIEVLEN